MSRRIGGHRSRLTKCIALSWQRVPGWPRICAEAGTALVRTEQYTLAREFLETARLYQVRQIISGPFGRETYRAAPAIIITAIHIKAAIVTFRIAARRKNWRQRQACS